MYSQDEAPRVLKAPGAHDVQPVELTAEEYVPAAQVTHEKFALTKEPGKQAAEMTRTLLLILSET